MTDPLHGTRPIVVEETLGKKAYCECGHSARLPYCDGSHSRLQTGVTPIVIEVAAPGKKAVCQCHQSGSLPWCDGTHSKLGSA
jgi:CDGSH-type Zn-finger protein